MTRALILLALLGACGADAEATLAVNPPQHLADVLVAAPQPLAVCPEPDMLERTAAVLAEVEAAFGETLLVLDDTRPCVLVQLVDDLPGSMVGHIGGSRATQVVVAIGPRAPAVTLLHELACHLLADTNEHVPEEQEGGRVSVCNGAWDARQLGLTDEDVAWIRAMGGL